MKNPYTLKPGEILTLEQLFDRYLDWGIWNKKKDRANKRSTCDTNLHYGHLCCRDHMSLDHEADDFQRYFRLLNEGHGGFSMVSMWKMIFNYDLKVDMAKVIRYWQVSDEDWQSVIEDFYDTADETD